MKVRDDIRSLSGVERVAVIVMALGEQYTSRIFDYLNDEEISGITQAMVMLGSVDPEIVERLCIEFAEQMSRSSGLMGSFESTERFLGKVLGEDRVRSLMTDVRGPSGRNMWEKLANVNETVLAGFLKNEYPQTVAVILCNIRADHAARVLSALPESLAQEVIMRILRMEGVKKEVLSDLERLLRDEFMSNIVQAQQKDQHEILAEIFNGLDRESEEAFMEDLEKRNKESAERVRSLMFTFEDLLQLDRGGMQTLLRSVENNVLSIALKGASDDLKEKVYENMSVRAANILKEDIASMGPVRVRDVDEAQSSMVNTAKDLAGKGEIVLAEGGGDNELIY